MRSTNALWNLNSVTGFMSAASFGIRRGLTNSVSSPRTKRSIEVRFGARCRERLLRVRMIDDMRMLRLIADGVSWRPDPRELEILRLVADGNSNVEAARRLGFSPRTVETYRSRLMEKLQLDDLPALVKFAIRNRIVSVD